MDYLNCQEIFSLRLNKIQLMFSRGNSERNLDGGQHRYSELLIFVVIPYVPLLTTNIQTVSNFLFWSVIQNCTFSLLFSTI